MERLFREDKPNYRGKMRSENWCVCDEESQTVQSDHDRADIRRIIKRYHQTGIIDELNQTQAQFADCTTFSDFGEIQRQMAKANELFMTLPPHVRKEFNNDVAEWLDAAHDQEKREALVEEGVIDDLEGTPERSTMEPNTENTGEEQSGTT